MPTLKTVLSSFTLSLVLSAACVSTATAQTAAASTKQPSGKTVQSHDALLVTGFQLVRAGRYKEAVDYFSGAVKLSPNNWQDLFYRGKAYSLSGELTKAIADLTQSIKLNSDNPYAVLERGKLYYNGPKNYKAALADLNQSVKVLPNDASAHEYRGMVLSSTGKHADAIGEYTNALALVAVSPPLSREAFAKKHFGEVNVEQAEKIKARIYYLRGKAKNNCKQYPSAFSDLEYSAKLDSSTYPVFLERAKTLVKLNKKEQAIADIDRATSMARSPEVYKTASTLFTELGDAKRADEAWKKAEPEAPGTSDSVTLTTTAKPLPPESPGNEAKQHSLDGGSGSIPPAASVATPPAEGQSPKGTTTVPAEPATPSAAPTSTPPPVTPSPAATPERK